MTLINIVLASVLAGLSVALPSLWFLSLFAITLFFYVLLFQIDSWRQASLSGSLFGISTVGASIWWVWDTLPLKWIDVDSTFTQWGAVFITWIFVSATLSVAPTLYALLIWKIRKKRFALLLIAPFWVLQEISREWLFYFVTLGDQSLPGAHFSISSLGYTLAENDYLLQLADTVGIYGLSFIVALIGITAAVSTQSLLTSEKLKQTYGIIFILLIVLSIPLWNKHTTNNTDLMNFSLITADIPVDSTPAPSTVYKKLLDEIASYDKLPDVIVFPEGGGLSELYPTQEQKDVELKKLFGDKEVLIINSTYTIDRNGNNHSVLYYDSSTRGNIGFYEKMFLMPHGEYATYVSSPLFKILQNKKVNEHFDSLGESLVRGDSLKAVSYKDLNIGGLLCTETLSPRMYRRLVKEHGANILINLSHTSWFNGSKVLFSKMKQMAKVHAVQNRTYFIQTSNGFPSFVLDSNGKIVIETNKGETKVINIDIPIPIK